MTKRKRTQGQTMIYKTLHIKQHKSHKKNMGELMCSGMASNSCSTSDTRRVTQVTTFSFIMNIPDIWLNSL